MASAATDRTVNKIALCSAVFAGVAYVGYSFAKRAFAKSAVAGGGGGGGRAQQRREDGSTSPSALEVFGNNSRRVHLRRLSGSEVGTLMGDRLILGPLSVQERIRELNLRARHFAETILAVQVQQRGSNAKRMVKQQTRSLQTSPTRCSPALSPIDITHLGSSRCSSIENLSLDCSSAAFSSLSRKSLRGRSSKRSFKMKSSDSGTFSNKEDELEAEGERLLDERETELRKRLQGFEDGTTKILTPYEAKSLVALLHSKDGDMVERALITISNSAAFTANQDHLRESGCLIRLQVLLMHPEVRVRLAALTATANLALNTANQKEMGDVVPRLLPVVESSSLNNEENNLLLYQTLVTLTNVAALSDWHYQFKDALTGLLSLTQCPTSQLRMQSLRLLVNLSTNEAMVPHLLAAKAPEHVCVMLSESSEAQLLRVLTLLANLVCGARKRDEEGPDPTLDLPLDDTTAEPDSLFSYLFSSVRRPEVLAQLEYLMTAHPTEEIRAKARMIHSVVVQTSGESE